MSKLKKYLVEIYAFFKHLRQLNYLRNELNERGSYKIKALQVPFRIMANGRTKEYTIYKRGVSFAPVVPLGNIPASEEAIYVNGMMTSSARAKMEADMLSEGLDRNFTLFYNDTHGFWEDIYDCIRMKIGNKSDLSSRGLARYIEECYINNGKRDFFIVGYSQGAIIACHAIDQLPEELKSNIEITLVTIGSAQDELSPFNGTATHICHKDDFVACIGAITYSKRNNMFGTLKIFNGKKHLLEPYIKTIEYYL